MVELYNRSLQDKKISNNKDIADAIAKTALEVEKSNDNLSVLVVPIPDPKTPLAEPIVSAVFDGHGGSYVSQLLGEKFVPSLRRNATLALSPNIPEYLIEMEKATKKKTGQDYKEAVVQLATRFQIDRSVRNSDRCVQLAVEAAQYHHIDSFYYLAIRLSEKGVFL